MKRLFVALLLISFSALGQSKPVIATAVVSGTTVPSSCTAGRVFVKTNASPSSSQFYVCDVSTKTFVLQGGASGSGAYYMVSNPAGGIVGSSTLWGPIAGTAGWATPEVNSLIGAPATATYSNLCVTLRAAQPATGTLVATLRKASASTALVVTIPLSSAAGTYCDTTHTVAITAGDQLDIQLTNNASTNSAIVNGTTILTQ